ncbi:MAG: hypothetical protein AAFY29_12025 [Pseudomonadota bacterium]
MTKTQSMALKIAAILWIVWGLVHVAAGSIVLTADAASGLKAIADAVAPDRLNHDYHAAVGGILNQHGWNLAWFGAVTIVGAVYIWRSSVTAIWVVGLVGGMADLGYFFFVDIPGYVNFLPGTLMTLISGSAILLSFWVWWGSPSGRQT